MAPDTTTAEASSDYGIVLPDEVAVVPSSYAGPTPTGCNSPPCRRRHGPNAGPALDVFPDAPDARVPEEPADDIVWAAPNTPRGEVDRLIAKYAAYLRSA